MGLHQHFKTCHLLFLKGKKCSHGCWRICSLMTVWKHRLRLYFLWESVCVLGRGVCVCGIWMCVVWAVCVRVCARVYMWALPTTTDQLTPSHAVSPSWPGAMAMPHTHSLHHGCCRDTPAHGTTAAPSPASTQKCGEAGAVRGTRPGRSDKQADDSTAESRQGSSPSEIS